MQIVTHHIPNEPLSPTLAEERRLILAAATDFALQSCESANLTLPSIFTRTLQQERVAAAGTSAEAEFDNLVERAKGITEGPELSGPIVPREITESPVVRIYIHIATQDQRAAGGRPIVVPGIELVERGGDNTVRCLKSDDCRLVS